MSGATYSYGLMGNRQSESIILNATQTGGTLRTAWNYSTGSQNTYSGILASSGLTYTGVFLSGTLIYDNNGNIRENQNEYIITISQFSAWTDIFSDILFVWIIDLRLLDIF